MMLIVYLSDYTFDKFYIFDTWINTWYITIRRQTSETKRIAEWTQPSKNWNSKRMDRFADIGESYVICFSVVVFINYVSLFFFCVLFFILFSEYYIFD